MLASALKFAAPPLFGVVLTAGATIAEIDPLWLIVILLLYGPKRIEQAHRMLGRFLDASRDHRRPRWKEFPNSDPLSGRESDSQDGGDRRKL